MGSKGSTKTESTVTQTNLPEYVEPYFTGLLDDTEAWTTRDYIPYEEPRLAGMHGDQTTSYDMIRDVAGSGVPYLDDAAGVSQANINAVPGLTQYDPYQYSAQSGSAYDFSPSGVFTPGAAGFYMSPYMQNVVNVQQADARRQYDISQAGRNADAINAGAFGGSRDAVVNSLAQEDLMRQLGGIQATGSQNAYEAATSAFEADRGARMGVEGMSAEELARVQGISVDEAARIQSGQAGEDSAAKRLALEGLGFTSEEAARLAGYGSAERTADIQSAQLLEQSGKAQQAWEQAGLDISYDDFLRQEGFPEQQIQLMSSILHGVPITPTSTTDTYTPYNPIGEALGAGISALGLYQGLTV